MTRLLLNFLTALSLLLCVAMVALWMRSYYARDMLKVRPGTWLLVVHSATDQGSVLCSWTWHSDFNLGPWRARYVADHPEQDIYTSWMTSDIRERVIFQRAGFAAAGQGSYAGSGGLIVPFWFVAACTGFIPTLRLARWFRLRRRGRAGLCPHCGYDLRATPDRCPECGHTPAGATA